jgi:hypothetical protein
MASPKLGEVLVHLGACSARDVEDALQNQVILGGTIGTNLLEMGAVTEAQLAAALTQVHGLPSLHGEIAVDPDAARLVTRELVERTEVVPLRLEGRRLVVLVANPAALQAFDEVAFATGKQLVPFVAAEVRVWGLMRQIYGIDRQLRGIEIEPEAPRKRPGPVAPVTAASAAPAVHGDLMSEETFEEMYERRAPGSPGSDDTALVPTAAALPIEEDLPEIDLVEEVVEAAAAPEPIVEPQPLTFGEASLLLAGVGDRKAIAQTVLRYARSKFKRAVLLTVHDHMARGWEGLGEDLTPQRVHSLQVKLGEPGVFETVVATRAHYLGPMLKTDQNLRYLKALGGGAPRSVFVMPILTLGKVVNVLYADDRRGAFVNPDVGELLILAAKISQSYDALLGRRRPQA